MRRAVGLLVALGLAAIAFIVFLSVAVDRVEGDIQGRVREVLDDNGYEAAELTIDGRDVAVSGVDPDDQERIRELIGDLEGVRKVSVDDADVAEEATPAGTEPASVRLTISGAEVTVAGEVSDQAIADAIVASLTDAFGRPIAGNIVTRPEIDPGAAALVAELAADAAPSLASARAQGTVAITNTGISGEVVVGSEGVAATLSDIIERFDPTTTLVVGTLSLGPEPTEPAVDGPLGDPDLADTMLDIATRTIRFATDSTELDSAAEDAIEAVAGALADDDLSVIVIGGRTATESVGLGLERADVVRDALVSAGVDRDQVTVGDPGDDGPVVTFIPRAQGSS